MVGAIIPIKVGGNDPPLAREKTSNSPHGDYRKKYLIVIVL